MIDAYKEVKGEGEEVLGGARGEVQEVEGQGSREEEEGEEELRVEQARLTLERGEKGVESQLDDRVVTDLVVPEDKGQAVDDANHDDCQYQAGQ